MASATEKPSYALHWYLPRSPNRTFEIWSLSFRGIILSGSLERAILCHVIMIGLPSNAHVTFPGWSTLIVWVFWWSALTRSFTPSGGRKIKKQREYKNNYRTIKKPMILCARSTSVEITWTEHEAQIKQREHVKGLFFYSQNNKTVWLSNMADSFTRRKCLWAFFLDCAFRVLIGWADKHQSHGWHFIVPSLCL